MENLLTPSATAQIAWSCYLVWKSRSAEAAQQSARVPDNVRLYVVGDVHGRADLLAQVFARIDADLSNYPISQSVEIYLGDYVDRGPASRDVLDQLVLRRRTCQLSHTHQLICLKGNHEAFLLGFIDNPGILADWQRYGGLETLVSYGLKPSMNADEREQAELSMALKSVLPAGHHDFLRSLELAFVCGDFFFVHAGVRPGVPLEQQREEDLLWIREDFLLHEEDFGKIIIHGHTPVMEPEFRPNRINVDTGAYATGKLTCLALEADKLFFI